MTSTSRSERWALVLGLGLVGLPWLVCEWWGFDPAVRTGVRVGLGVGVLSFPVHLWIYRGAFRGPFRRALRAMVVSMGFKAVVLVGTGGFVWWWDALPVMPVIGPLFYVLFTLGFLAISLSWLRGPKDSQGT